MHLGERVRPRHSLLASVPRGNTVTTRMTGVIIERYASAWGTTLYNVMFEMPDAARVNVVEGVSERDLISLSYSGATLDR